MFDLNIGSIDLQTRVKAINEKASNRMKVCNRFLMLLGQHNVDGIINAVFVREEQRRQGFG